jgi:hypothetical protein
MNSKIEDLTRAQLRKAQRGSYALRVGSCATMHGNRPCMCERHERPHLRCDSCKSFEAHRPAGKQAVLDYEKKLVGWSIQFTCTVCNTTRRYGME